MSPLDAIGWKATGLRNRIYDRMWERRLGIQTTGWVEVDHPDANRYATMSYLSIRKIIHRLEMGPGDVFVDLGCGKGRVLCCAAMSRARKVIGVDIDDQLCENARRNAARMRLPKTAIEVVHAPAQEFDFRGITKIYLFNSFGAATLRLVLSNMEASIRSNPRRISLAYVNPMHDAVIGETDGFVREAQWRRRPWTGLKFDVSFWRHPGHEG